MSSPFLDRLKLFGNSDAVVFGDKIYSYDFLLNEVDDWRRYLLRNGVADGDVVALEGAFSPRMCAGLLALVDSGAISVPVNDLIAAYQGALLSTAEAET